MEIFFGRFSDVPSLGSPSDLLLLVTLPLVVYASIDQFLGSVLETWQRHTDRILPELERQKKFNPDTAVAMEGIYRLAREEIRRCSGWPIWAIRFALVAIVAGVGSKIFKTFILAAVPSLRDLGPCVDPAIWVFLLLMALAVVRMGGTVVHVRRMLDSP